MRDFEPILEVSISCADPNIQTKKAFDSFSVDKRGKTAMYIKRILRGPTRPGWAQAPPRHPTLKFMIRSTVLPKKVLSAFSTLLYLAFYNLYLLIPPSVTH
jgi:hypothetical protein